MPIRIASVDDISEMHNIRIAVHENMLSHPDKINADDYKDYLLNRGRGWIHYDEAINGFAIVSLYDHMVWALFVHPDAEKKGVGSALHDTMVAWYFSQTSTPLSLTTSPRTRAERFYRAAGWVEQGMKGDELVFIKYA